MVMIMTIMHDSDDDNVHPRKIARKYVSLTDKLTT